MNYELLTAFLTFIRYEYSNEAAYGRWCQGLIRKIRAANPGTMKFGSYDFNRYGSFETDGRGAVSVIAAGFAATMDQAARLLVEAMRKPFVRLWNRSANPGAMFELCNVAGNQPRRQLLVYEDFSNAESEARAMMEEAQEAKDNVRADWFQDRLYSLERAATDPDYAGGWEDFFREVAMSTAQIVPSDYNARGYLLQPARERLFEVNNEYADDIREKCTRPDPRDVFRKPPR